MPTGPSPVAGLAPEARGHPWRTARRCYAAAAVFGAAAEVPFGAGAEAFFSASSTSAGRKYAGLEGAEGRIEVEQRVDALGAGRDRGAGLVADALPVDDRHPRQRLQHGGAARVVVVPVVLAAGEVMLARAAITSAVVHGRTRTRTPGARSSQYGSRFKSRRIISSPLSWWLIPPLVAPGEARAR